MSDIPDFNQEVDEKIFNTAQLSILRIHKILTDCNNNSRSVVFDPIHLTYWKVNLETLFREIAAYMRNKKSKEDIEWSEEYKNHIERFKLIRIRYSEFITEYNAVPISKNYLPSSFDELYDLLNDCEIMLRVSLDKRGLLIPSKQSAGMAILNR